MDEKSQRNSEAFSLLQPELFTESELREILINRCVSRNLVNCSKTELVELFRRVALPLPQREYSERSSREKRLMQKQQRSKRVINFSDKDASSAKIEPQKKIPRLSNECTSPRLKPPPDLINYGKKVIKISDSSKSSSLDKIIIKKNSKAPAAKKEQESGESSNTETNGSTVSSSKPTNTVKLKRDPVQSKDEKSEDKDESTKKKKQKIVISW